MITGRQIREARELLHWDPSRLAKAAKVPWNTVKRAELLDVENVTFSHASAIQRALEAAGVEFTNGDQPGVRLRAK